MHHFFVAFSFILFYFLFFCISFTWRVILLHWSCPWNKNCIRIRPCLVILDFLFLQITNDNRKILRNRIWDSFLHNSCDDIFNIIKSVIPNFTILKMLNNNIQISFIQQSWIFFSQDKIFCTLFWWSLLIFHVSLTLFSRLPQFIISAFVILVFLFHCFISLYFYI